ncbi:hypothetical protein DY000_02010393 [Brassica cretica]|uniref:Uncharacterized protein n=1 Tax=Brassica cretica TaxID=69181 RepID=A0ABQ7BSD6_BRACR|nr:hypothetical protein DY000_02010393 [Brassica cretica]
MHATRPCGQTCGGRGVSLHGYRPCIQTGRGRGVTLHVSRSCNQQCGARGVAAHASGAMRSDTRAATRLVSDWLLITINSPRPLPFVLIQNTSNYSADFESAPGEGSVQVKRDQFYWRQVQDQSRRGSTCEGRGRVRIAEGPVTWKFDHGRRPGLTE